MVFLRLGISDIYSILRAYMAAAVQLAGWLPLPGM